jgi:hypothetical protein
MCFLGVMFPVPSGGSRSASFAGWSWNSWFIAVWNSPWGPWGVDPNPWIYIYINYTVYIKYNWIYSIDYMPLVINCI